jgi:hypothetical protein
MQAQGFRKKHFLPNTYSSACRDVIEAPNGNLIGLGISTDSTLGAYVLTVLGMDSQGSPLWKKSYVGNGVLYFDNDYHMRGPVLQDSTGFYHALTAWDGINPRAFGVLLRFNYSGDTLWQKKYKSADTLEDVMLQGMCKGADGGLLFTGLFQYWGTPAWQKGLILKTDIDGNELWRKKISKALPDVQDGKSIIQDSASKRIIYVGYQFSSSASFGVGGSVVIADSIGNKINQFTYNNYNGEGLSEVIQLQDKSFLVCGQKNANNNLSSNQRYYSFLAKFDLNGTVIWKKDYGELSIWTSIYVMQQMPNGNVLVAGYLDTMSNKNIGGVNDIPPVVKIKLMEIDPANGAVIKTRFIGNGAGLNTIEFPRSLRPTKDGGYVLAVNDADRMNPKPMSLIKIDANLCDTSDAYCKEQDEVGIVRIENKFGSVKIFPNPASTAITIEATAPISAVTIYAATGNIVSTLANTNHNNTLSVQVKELTPGLYYISIQTLNQNVITQKLTITR